MRRISCALLAAVLLLAAAGCGEKAAEKAVEKAIESRTGGKADVDISEGKLTVKSGGGEGGTFEFGENVKLPDGFPGDLPLYPGGKLMSAITTDRGMQVILGSGDATGAVYEFYRKKLPGSGWEIVQDMKMAPAYSLVGRKGERQAVVTIGEGGGQSTISLSVAREG